MLGDLGVSALGLGAWALTGTYGEVSDDHAIEKLVGRAFAGPREDVVVATKWGEVPWRVA